MFNIKCELIMTYTFTTEQLNAFILEIMELAEQGTTFEKWEVSKQANARLLTDVDNAWNEGEEPIWIDCDTGEEVTDSWYFYPIEGDPFDIEDLDAIKRHAHRFLKLTEDYGNSTT